MYLIFLICHAGRPGFNYSLMLKFQPLDTVLVPSPDNFDHNHRVIVICDST